MAEGVVYVGSDDGSLYAFDDFDGTTVWTAPTGGPVDSSPALLVSGPDVEASGG